MSQTWNLPLLGTDLLSASDDNLNDAFNSLRSHFLGTADPSSPVPVEGQFSINTSSGKIRGKRASDTVNLGDWAAEMGHIRSDGTIPLTADWNVGGFKITGLVDPTAVQDAATKTYADSNRGPTFLTAPVTAATITQATGNTWTTYDISTDITPSNASDVILQVENLFTGSDVGSTVAAFILQIDFRKTGLTTAQLQFKHRAIVDLDAGDQSWDSADFEMTNHIIVPLDSSNQFDYRHNSASTATNGTYAAPLKIIGYFKTT